MANAVCFLASSVEEIGEDERLNELKYEDGYADWLLVIQQAAS